ncbi:MAG: hypothetical protein QM698_12180 [Micropepsaceae bacterium]
MTNPLSGPLSGASLVQAGSLHPAGRDAAKARANAAAYAGAMREAGAPEAAAKVIKVSGETPARADHSREAPFGTDRPRLMRPGSLIDIRV